MMELCKLICKDGVLTVFLMRMVPGLPEIAFQSIMLICYLLLLTGGTVILRRHQGRRRFLQLSGVQLFCLLFPFFLYLYVREVQFSCLNLGSWKLWLQMEGILVAEAVCAELVMMMTGSMLSVQNERNELQKREMLLREKQQQYQMQKEAIEAINRKYHDLKHYLTGLEAMNSEELDEYVQAMKREIEPYERMQETGNEIMDVLLNERIRECQEKGIRLVPFVDGRELGFIRPLDLCAIFGNAMDNAIEATANLTYVNMREISLKIGVSDGMLIMRFQNYFDGILKREGEKILTSKENEQEHGYGLENIQTIVEQYDGAMACETQGQEFSLHILIPLPAL
jgi:sensor histidine kinase regulating citrate/malate metabolism